MYSQPLCEISHGAAYTEQNVVCVSVKPSMSVNDGRTVSLSPLSFGCDELDRVSETLKHRDAGLLQLRRLQSLCLLRAEKCRRLQLSSLQRT